VTAGRLEALADAEALARRAAGLMAAAAQEALAARGAAALCLAGGSTPLETYRLLARAGLAWERVHLFWGDERCLPPDHPDSNYGSARRALAAAPLAAANLHRIPAERGPAEGARRYQAELEAFFGGGPPAWDFLLLGLGADGHTASLFPGSAALAEERAWAVGVPPGAGASPPVARVTLTLPALNAARQAAFMAAGEAKAEALALARDGEAGLPAARVRPAGELWWLADAAAAPA
jgi:6-phosphogluconolactonase